MTRLRALLWIIAASQLVLGGLTLIAPTTFFGWMGLTAPPADNKYMLGMLAARFLAYGVGMAMLARQPIPDRFWILNMVLIQVIDLAVGIAYITTGALAPAVAAFPMFNATVFAVLLWLWQPRDERLLSATVS